MKEGKDKGEGKGQDTRDLKKDKTEGTEETRNEEIKVVLCLCLFDFILLLSLLPIPLFLVPYPLALDLFLFLFFLPVLSISLCLNIISLIPAVLCLFILLLWSLLQYAFLNRSFPQCLFFCFLIVIPYSFLSFLSLIFSKSSFQDYSMINSQGPKRYVKREITKG